MPIFGTSSTNFVQSGPLLSAAYQLLPNVDTINNKCVCYISAQILRYKCIQASGNGFQDIPVVMTGEKKCNK